MRTAENLGVSGFRVQRFAGLVWTLAQRDLKARFKGTLLGWLWSLIVPLATLGLYVLVFGVIFRAQVEPMGNGRAPSYAVWLFLGLIVFNFFSLGMLRASESLWSLAGVLNRVRVPILAPILAGLVSVGLQTMVELMLYLGVLAAFLNVGWTWLLLPLWALLFGVFTAGLSMAMAVFAVRYQDIHHLLGVVLTFLLFATPVMYPLSMVPAEASIGSVSLRELLGASPVAGFVDLARSLLYGLESGDVNEWLYLAASALIAAGIGLIVTSRYGSDVAEWLQ
ncbi:MAG TPA: ABC transporter permease [Aeromicrobium sp.]|nr:ABC transporter permease [Aeromicrobium sp.]